MTVLKITKFLMICFIAICCLAPVTVLAQQTLNPDRNEPLEITADQTLEWHRNNQKFIARGNVIVKQGKVTIAADILTADYREAGSSFEIYRLSADGHVKITAQGNIATGQKAVYEVDRGLAVMTGNNLSLTSPDQSVTARDSFEYWVAEGRLRALGNARVVRGEDRLDADSVSAVFAESAAGTRQLQSLDAEGHVRIATPDETLTGNKGHYSAAVNIATLTGDVRIMRDPNILEGEQAEVNLGTNISIMRGNTGLTGHSNGRVRGVFYPDSADKNP
ncbi:MAG: ostA-like family protein [Alphaproteobacteria bacterium CG_4_9_14_3_um_filter_47_13]|nr:MAG: ostA-like family protein [Alphaproteobacteria bacterium CG_4_9_14_3_um_filter_47_13]